MIWALELFSLMDNGNPLFTSTILARQNSIVLFGMVMKPGPDRTVRPEKPRTAHFCGSFSIKNRSRGQKQGPV